jgi:phosphoenolpyruvate-protein phosphotransferase (PTS system enzyme I)
VNILAGQTLKGIAASQGIAVGPVIVYQPPDLTIPDRLSEGVDVEFARFRNACEQARQELTGIRALMEKRTGGQEQAAIFDAHLAMLEDPMLAESVQKWVEAGKTVEWAVAEATHELSDMLACLEDELFAARAMDIQDVGQRVLRILLGIPEGSLTNLSVPSIVAAKDLTPSDTAKMDPAYTLGFCTAAGGLTSHSTILARTLGIPAVVGLGPKLMEVVRPGTRLVLDGTEGVIFVNPEEEIEKSYLAKEQERRSWLKRMQDMAGKKATTSNGRKVEVGANIGDAESAREAVRFGAEGVGLLRTEILYLEETRPPCEEKQISLYRAIFEAMGDRPVIVRTMDIGGDKPPSFLDFPAEMNPFLGWRAIRICLDDRPLFKTQLRAILRAALGHRALIMFPMISAVEELASARQVIQEVCAEMDAEGTAYAKDVPVGIMVEIPAAALMTDALARYADFFSLGTNDLTQYTLAVDRGNERVSSLYQPLHPAVLRLIKVTIENAHKAGKWVGMCGELAGMQKAIPILLGLGLDEFSMIPRAIPEAKWLIGQLSDDETRQIAERALGLDTAAEIEAYMKEVLAKYSSSL